jgi:glyoxylase-like metal-dependent hydrolase (beta-lactamase superfamily II)
MVITHAHPDHFGLAREIKDLSGGKLAIHQQEVEWLESGRSPVPPGITLLGRLISVMSRKIPEIRVNAVDADILIEDDGIPLDKYGISGKVIYTLGHTSGSECLTGQWESFHR